MKSFMPTKSRPSALPRGGKVAYTVASAKVPKMGLMGLQVGSEPTRGFSKEGHDILESYTRQASDVSVTFRAAESSTPGAGCPLTAIVMDNPQVEFLTPTTSPLQSADGRPHTSRPYLSSVDESVPAVWGAWMPSTKSKPPLLRNNPRMTTSPRTDSQGRTSFGPNVFDNYHVGLTWLHDFSRHQTITIERSSCTTRRTTTATCDCRAQPVFILQTEAGAHFT